MAQRLDAVILSLDSLSIYKEIDIASAKPPLSERGGIKHFGIDVITPDRSFSVATFIELYRQAREYAQKQGKNLIIVGGTGFYLDALLRGISELPEIEPKNRDRAAKLLEDKQVAYELLLDLEPDTTIEKNDTYRIQKALELYFQTGLTRKAYFSKHPPRPVITEKVQIFEIDVERKLLHERIQKRTQKMFAAGIVEEVQRLLERYGRSPQAFKAIGIKEVVEYLDGKIDREKAMELVTIHTRQLAKRQRTFNRSRFKERISLPLEKLEETIISRCAT